jgi:hypothetical protein
MAAIAASNTIMAQTLVVVLGSHDANALTALNAAQTESLIERIAERVALKLRE